MMMTVLCLNARALFFYLLGVSGAWVDSFPLTYFLSNIDWHWSINGRYLFTSIVFLFPLFTFFKWGFIYGNWVVFP